MGSNEVSTNPFDEDESYDAKVEKSFGDVRDISYHDIATKLLNDNLLLTALELHAELVENGKELPKLSIFFSNPGNFEQHTVPKAELLCSSIPRSSSQATLDSLDLTRYSEDGERGVDERVAVLEFELRKAKETINALRANLTVAIESDSSTPDGSGVKALGIEPVKPHEQRALNFLINEYLLYYGYKLTSITFSDENENQDFEDWDDVGLNIPKPAELLQLYRDFMRQSVILKPTGINVACQTITNHEEFNVVTARNHDQDLKHKRNISETLHDETAMLLEQIDGLRKEKQELNEKLWTLERVAGFAGPFETQTKKASNVIKECPQPDYEDGWTAVIPLDLRDLQQHSAEEDPISVDIDWASVTMSTPDPAKIPRSGSQSGSGSGSAYGASETRAIVMEDDDHISADTEWTAIGHTSTHNISQSKARCSPSPFRLDSLHFNFERKLSEAFCKELFSCCLVDTSHLHENYQHLADIMTKVAELSQPVDSLTSKLVDVLERTLLKLLPCVILNKREELIPLLVSLIRLHPDSKERDVLLHQLFNLKKRPGEEERRVILSGLVCVAQGLEIELVENEVLPQLWEQMNHKYVERRLLVVEACGVLAPYVTSAIRNSLILSMLQQMLSEDREDTIRAAIVRSTAFIAAMSPDCDKYMQCEDLVISCISDLSPSVFNCVTETLLPVVAHWALTSGRLQSSLWMKLLNQLIIQLQTKAIESPRSPSLFPSAGGSSFQTALNVTVALSSILPHLVLCVANVEPVISRISAELPTPLPRVGFSELCRGLANPVVFHFGSASVGQIMAAFDVLTKESGVQSYWPELVWISEKMLPDVIDALNSVGLLQEDLLNAFVAFFRFLSAGLGPVVVARLIKPIFTCKLKDLERSLIEAAVSGQKPLWPSLSILVVYLGGVLSLSQSEEEMEDLHSTLKRFLMALPLCPGSFSMKFGSSPVDGLKTAISSLCSTNRENIHEAVLATLWEGVVSQRAQVRCATATLFGAVIGPIPETLISTKVTPALVTLASDPDVSVKTATVPTFGKLLTSTTTKEVKEKVCFQLQSVLSDPVTRDSHPLLLQLVATLGQVVPSCDASFREDVILPQIAGLAAYMSQLQNLTRRLDLAVALIEAFSAAIYISLPVPVLTSSVLPGLHYLNQVSQELQPVHQETVSAMIREVESRCYVLPHQQDDRRSHRAFAAATANMNQGVEDMRQRMSKIFQPKNQTTLPNLFRKKQ